YDAPQQVEGVFKWDVTDIFYNYFFVGNSIKMGGEAGWDTSQIDIYNLDAIASLRVYQDLNQFFSIDTSKSDYEAILDEFMEGKMVFTMATTDAVFKLEQAKADGLFEYDYDIALTPDIDESRKTRSLSMTSCVVINGYSENREDANDFAYFLTAEYNDILYARTGKVSAAKGVDYGYEALDKFAQEYEQSISMPKMIETSNFWVKLEVAFSQIWNGADANDKLKELSEQIMSQVTGTAYEETYLEEPKESEEEAYQEEVGDTQEEAEE
ncbi:MAG: sugar ABC transporter substrate-binding protein, partial [Lachnospiraceae bacterium]|nr:sugar ABC transporter substrate-binding protein [Lachnospiraceae bacterium]